MLRNRNFHLTAIGFLIFLILGYVSERYFESPNSKKALIEEYTEEIHSIINQSELLLEEFEAIYLKDERLSIVSDDYVELQESNMHFFVLNNNKLEYWSSNSIDIDALGACEHSEIAVIETSNGWYLCNSKANDSLSFILMYQLFRTYDYANEFLNTGSTSKLFKNYNIKVLSERDYFNVVDKKGDFLFGIQFSEQEIYFSEQLSLAFLCYIIALLLLLALIYIIYFHGNWLKMTSSFIFILFFVDLVIIRFILFYFQLPSAFYSNIIFSPYLFAYSEVLPSLGEFFIHSIFLLLAAIAFYKKVTIHKQASVGFRIGISVVLLFIAMGYFYFVLKLFDIIIENSNFIARFASFEKGIQWIDLVYVIVSALFLSVFLFAYKAIKIVQQQLQERKEQLICLGLLVIGCVIPLVFLPNEVTESFFYIIVFLFLLWLMTTRSTAYINATFIVFFVLFFSIVATLDFNYLQSKSNDEKVDMLASKLATNRDFVAEFEFEQLKTTINSELNLEEIRLLVDEARLAYFETRVQRAIDESYLNKYESYITICKPDEILDIQPEGYLIDCNEFFNSRIRNESENTSNPSFQLLRTITGSYHYLAHINYDVEGIIYDIYIEFISNYIPEGLGYPELLLDKDANIIPELSQYSFAKYEKEDLIYKFGNYFYSTKLSSYLPQDTLTEKLEKNGYIHYYYPLEGNDAIIISKKEPTLLDILAPFSYFFIFNSLFLLLVIGFILPYKISEFEWSFRRRLQLSIVFFILVSFLIIGGLSLIYIVKLNNDKNHDILSEKTHSVLIELEHKLANEQSLNPEMQDYLSALLNKFSLVFFSDINMYTLDGDLLASSRPKIFDEGLISQKMNPEAYRSLKYDKKLLFINTERIGNYQYLSAYVPFRNADNQLIAYLNLPYFALQDQLQQEITTFLIAYINIYVILFIIALLVVIIISRYISRPLQLIKDKMSEIELGKSNAKIEWNRQDEIGSLISDYNRMIDELAHSASLLAKSERESAWREMAKQVAHEIKNPLTPMKLSVQYLKKAWDEKAPNWEDRLNNFTQTLIEQIDTLSSIASEFSDFAKMPVAKKIELNLIDVIHASIDLFKDIDNIEFDFQSEVSEAHVYADNKQLIRVLNNLIQNSIQAIGLEKGSIIVSIQPKDNAYLVSVKDTGCGIKKEQADKIFSPSFTTKSSGMGLGLSIVKSIIHDLEGEIWFETKVGEGSVFYFTIPTFVKKND